MLVVNILLPFPISRSTYACYNFSRLWRKTTHHLRLCLYFSQPESSSEEGSEKRRHWRKYQERKGSSVSLNEPLIEVPRSLTTRVPGEKYQNTLLAVTDCLTQEDCLGHGTGGLGAFCFLKDYSWLMELKRHEQKSHLSGEKQSLHFFVNFNPNILTFIHNCLLWSHFYQVWSWPLQRTERYFPFPLC